MFTEKMRHRHAIGTAADGEQHRGLAQFKTGITAEVIQP
jgi:hypothetical protein